MAIVESARQHRTIEPLLLALSLSIFTVLSAVPLPLATNPSADGPRYYFLPFVSLSWLLLVLLLDARLSRATRVLAGALLAAAAIGLLSNLVRPAETATGRLDWREEIARCAVSTRPVVKVPIYTDGSIEHLWMLRLTPAECRARL